MPNREPHLTGEIVARLSFRRLVSLLRAAGLSSEVRDSSHYEGGRYVRVTEDGDFTLERIASGELLARATMDTDQQLFDVASCASTALARQGIQHRFELYDDQSNLVHYLHHLWPPGSSA